jgi:uncharacterized repeat protein (TIGR04138 family)
VNEQDHAIRLIVKQDPRFDREAYHFVSDALAFTVHQARESREELGMLDLPREEQHVSGRDMLKGIRELALERFGPLAPVVFEHWGIRSTLDFGHVVFNMIEARLMSKRESDRVEDFADGFDFSKAFDVELDLEIVD